MTDFIFVSFLVLGEIISIKFKCWFYSFFLAKTCTDSPLPKDRGEFIMGTCTGQETTDSTCILQCAQGIL